MSKSIKLSDAEIEQFLSVYQEKKEALNGEMQDLKTRLNSVTDMIKQLQEAKGGAVKSTTKSNDAAPTGKRRGRKPAANKTPKAPKAPKTPGKRGRKPAVDADGSRVSFASKIVDAINERDRALSASEIFDAMAESEGTQDAAQQTKYKQNIHSNLNNLFKRGTLKRMKDGKSFAYGLSEWFDQKGEIDQAHAPVRSESEA